MFGLKYDLLIDGQNTFKTKTGGKLTILYFIIVLGLFFSFGIDLYLRKNPKISLNTIVSDDYENVYLNNSNATLAFRIEDVDGKLYKNHSIIEGFNISIQSLIIKNGKWDNLTENLITYKNCNELLNYDEIKKKYNKDLDQWFCMDFDAVNFLGGNWDGKFNKYVDTKIYLNK